MNFNENTWFVDMPVSKIINLFFVSLAAAIVVGIFVYVCVQRYKSFMRSRMNFVLSVIPKAQYTLRKLDPKRISVAIKTSKTTNEVSTTDGTAAPVATRAPEVSTVTEPPPIDAATARLLQQLANASQQIAPAQWLQKSTTPKPNTQDPNAPQDAPRSSVWGWLS